MSYDVSIFMPSIRTYKQPGWYESIKSSCKNHTFQVVIAGPFELHDDIKNLSNVKFIKTYSHPTKSAQLAALACDGNLIYHTTDDVLFYDDAIDKSIWYYKSVCKEDDIVSMRYIEGKSHSNKTSYPPEYWSMQNFLNGNGGGFIRVPPTWRCNAQFLMSLKSFKKFGGFDCNFEYLTHAAADLELRMLIKGSTFVYDSPVDVSNADWFEGTSVDHEPIHYAQIEHDTNMFSHKWSTGIVDGQCKRDFISIDNHKNHPDHWERRFKNQTPGSYNDLSLNPPK